MPTEITVLSPAEAKVISHVSCSFVKHNWNWSDPEATSHKLAQRHASIHEEFLPAGRLTEALL